MRIYLYISTLLMLVSCSGSKGLVGNEKNNNEPQPEWISNRPVSGAYYIGIGSANKNTDPVNFAANAKSNALSDLASEISVTIKSESFLNVLEVNKNFQEQFLSQVNAVSDEYVEGFEMIDSWQDKDQYWVYYRLSKSKHEEIQRKLKNEVLSSAYDSYKRGKSSEYDGDIISAMDHYLSGLAAMEKYWNEPNPYTFESGEEVYLDNEIYHSMLSIINGLKIDVPLSEIELNSDNDFSKEVGIRTLLNGQEVGQIPLIYNFDQDKYTRNKAISSNNEGLVSVEVRNARLNSSDNNLMVAIDVDQLIRNFRNDPLMKEVTDNFIQQVVYVPIRIKMPKLFVESYETNLGEQLESAYLANALKNELTDMGMNLAGSVNSSDYLVQIKSTTKEGGTSQGFHVSYLEFEIEVKNRMTGDLVYQNSVRQVKGLQLNFSAAGMEAYKKAAKMIEKEIAEELMDSII